MIKKPSQSKARIKVLYIISSMGRGGRERQLYELLKCISGDIDAHLVVLSAKIEYPITDLKIPLTIIPGTSRRSIMQNISIIANLRRQVPDIVHYWDGISSLYAISASLLTRTKLIDGRIRYAGYYNLGVMGTIIKRFCFYMANAIIGNSQAGLQGEGLVDNPKASVIYNGIDLSRFVTIINSESRVNNDIKNQIKIVMVAGFRPDKLHHVLLEVAERLDKSTNGVQIVLVGDGPTKQEIEKRAKKLVDINVHFTGMREDVESILLSCDIGILLSESEGLSNAVMEYMAAGLPVIVSNGGGSSELVIEGVTGFLVDTSNISGIAVKLQELIDNPGQRHAFGREGRKRIEQFFSNEIMSTRYLKVYHKFVATETR